MTGQVDSSRALASEVQALAERADMALATHWREATLGEAALLLGQRERSAEHYAAAVAAAGIHLGHVASMRRQLRLLSTRVDVPDIRAWRYQASVGSFASRTDEFSSQNPERLFGFMNWLALAVLTLLLSLLAYCFHGHLESRRTRWGRRTTPPMLAPVGRSVRCQPKPPWVPREIVRLKALSPEPELGCRGDAAVWQRGSDAASRWSGGTSAPPFLCKP